MGEDQLAAAMQVLVAAGLPEDQAQMLMQVLSQPQGGPGNTDQTPPQGNEIPEVSGPITVPQAGTPRAMQGEMM